MKILQVVASLGLRHGGVSTSVINLCRGLAGAGEAITIWTTRRGYSETIDGPALAELMAAGVTIRYFPVHHSRLLGERYAYAPEMDRAFRENLSQFDLVHIHAVWLYTTYSAAKWCRRLKIPYLLSPCGGLDPYGMAQHRLFKILYGWLVERRNLSGAAGIHLTSTFEQERACLFGVDRPTAVVPRPLRMEEIPLSARGNFRSRHPELSGQKLLLFLGRLHAKKRPTLAAEMFIRLARRRPDLHLVLAGPDDGEERRVRALLQTAGLLSRTTFTGMIAGPEKWALYLDSDLFLLPSEDENFGVTVLEALAAGLPALVSPSVGAADAVRESGAGRVIPARADLWAETAGQLLEDPAALRTLGESGRRWVKDHFSIEQIAQQMQAVYANALKGART